MNKTSQTEKLSQLLTVTNETHLFPGSYGGQEGVLPLNFWVNISIFIGKD